MGDPSVSSLRVAEFHFGNQNIWVPQLLFVEHAVCKPSIVHIIVPSLCLSVEVISDAVAYLATCWFHWLLMLEYRSSTRHLIAFR